jgi:hypothetical protein
MGNHQVRFLGEGAAAMPFPYPTPKTKMHGIRDASCDLKIANFRAMSEDVSGTGTHRPGVWKPL